MVRRLWGSPASLQLSSDWLEHMARKSVKAKPKVAAARRAPVKTKPKAKLAMPSAGKTAPAPKGRGAVAKPVPTAKKGSRAKLKPVPTAKLKPVPTAIKRKLKPAPAPRKPKPVKFDAKALASIKEGLLTEQAELLTQLREMEEAFDPAQVEASGEAGYDDDYADAGTATFEREKDLSIAANVQDLLDKIEKALSKITDGSYGRCESCGDPISSERLKALPHALLCIRCKTAEERR